MTYFDDLKYDEFVSNMDGYFKNTQVINFDIIHHVCRSDKLQNPKKFYKTIRNNDFNNYEQHIRDNAFSSAIKSERNNIHFEQKSSKRSFWRKNRNWKCNTFQWFFLEKEKKNTTNFTNLKF